MKLITKINFILLLLMVSSCSDEELHRFLKYDPAYFNKVKMFPSSLNIRYNRGNWTFKNPKSDFFIEGVYSKTDPIGKILVFFSRPDSLPDVINWKNCANRYDENLVYKLSKNHFTTVSWKINNTENSRIIYFTATKSKLAKDSLRLDTVRVEEIHYKMRGDSLITVQKYASNNRNMQLMNSKSKIEY